jgi:DNA-binding MurR/RpiR family transcriptional regulator
MTFHDAQLPNDLLGRIRAQMGEMTKSDHKIAEYLLASPSTFAVASVRSIATDIGISEPTVVRFCRTLGCDGFKDFKFRLTQELAFAQARSDALPSTEEPASGSVSRLATRHPNANHIHDQARSAMAAVAEALPGSEALQRAAAAVAGARRTLVYGIGGSSAILAEEVHNRLFRLGLGSVCYTDSYAQRMAAAAVGRNDVALFVTSTGRPRSLQDSLELAKYYGATTVAITDPESPIGRDADICIDVPLTQAGVHEFQPNPMRYGQLLAIDLLAFAVAEAMGVEASRVLRQTRGSIASLHGIAPQQPIGD